MQKKKWVRVGFGVAIVGGAFGAVSAAGCSGDDTSTNNPNDAGHDSSMTTGDSSMTGDSSPAGDSAMTMDGAETGAPVYAKVYIVHAATDPLSVPLRFCFGISPVDAGTSTVTGGIIPFPDSVTLPGGIAGLYPGFGGSTASSPTLKTFDLSGFSIELYAIDATQIANDSAAGAEAGTAEVACEKLIGADGLGASADGGASALGGTLIRNKQFWSLGTIPKGTLNHGQTWVAAVTGCFPGEPAPGAGGPGSALCNSPLDTTQPAYDATNGNLALRAWQVDNTTAVTGDAGIGAQFANASTAWDTVALGTVAPDAGNAGTAAGFWTLEAAPTPDGGGGEAGSGEGGGGDDGGGDGGGGSDAGAVDSGPPPAPVFAFNPITAAGAFGTLTPAALDTVQNVPLNVPNAGFATAIAFSGGTPPILQIPPGCTLGESCLSPYIVPLPVIDELSNGATLSAQGIVTTPAGGSYAYGKGYVFILVGDPTAAPEIGGQANPRLAHFLAFPTSNP
ncbi:MAG TPA: hypothetical protein VGL81_36050 [Polyangiaceae bacterium]|jgi:hypothetical protein